MAVLKIKDPEWQNTFSPRTEEDIDKYLNYIKMRREPAQLRSSDIEKKLSAMKKIKQVRENIVELFGFAMYYISVANSIEVTHLRFPVPYFGWEAHQKYPQIGEINFYRDGKEALHMVFHRGCPATAHIEILQGGIGDLSYDELAALWESRAYILWQLCFLYPSLEKALGDLSATADSL